MPFLSLWKSMKALQHVTISVGMNLLLSFVTTMIPPFFGTTCWTAPMTVRYSIYDACIKTLQNLFFHCFLCSSIQSALMLYRRLVILFYEDFMHTKKWADPFLYWRSSNQLLSCDQSILNG